MRFVAVVPYEGTTVALGPFNSLKDASGHASAWGGHVVPMLRVNRFGEIESRGDLPFPPSPPETTIDAKNITEMGGQPFGRGSFGL